MPDNETAQLETDRPSLAAGLPEAFRVITTMARNADAPDQFLRDVLKCATEILKSPYGLIYVQSSSHVIEDYCHSGSSDPAFWRPVVQRFLNDALSEGVAKCRLFQSKKTKHNVAIALISAPVRDQDGAPVGAMAFVVPSRDATDAKDKLRMLQGILGLASFCASFIGKEDPQDRGDSPAGSRAYKTLKKYKSVHELAFALTNNLRNKMNSDQVALGRVIGRQVVILAVSGHDHVHPSSPQVACIRQAMEECLDAETPIIYQSATPDAPPEDNRRYRLHRQWHAAAGHMAVASIPLADDEGYNAILSIRASADQSLTHEQLHNIRDLVEPHTAVIEILDHANRNLIAHACASVRGSVQALLAPGGWIKKAMLAMLITFLAWFCFGSLTHTITVPANIIPAQTRHLTSPFEAALLASHALQGDRVKQGDILCRFDTREFQKQREQIQSQLKIAQLDEETARAARSNAQMQLARAQQNYFQALLDTTDLRIAQATIRAPFDGIIINGDLRRRVGEILPKGEPLFEVATDTQCRLELHIPEQSSAELAAGLNGRFLANARPEQAYDLTLSHVNPNAELRNNRNVYIAEADLTATPDWIKPGMEGAARVEIGSKPVWWVVFHRVIDKLHLTLWI